MTQDDAKKGRAIRAVVDRIEDGGMAVLLIGDGQNTIDVPVSLLPAGTTDGDHLRINFSLDKDARGAAADRVKKMQDQLAGRSGAAADQKDFKV